MPEHIRDDSDVLDLRKLLARADTGSGGPWEKRTLVVRRLAEFLRGCLARLDPPGGLELAMVWAPILAHHVAPNGIEVEGCVGREVDLSALDAYGLALGPEALLVVIKDGWEESKDLVL